MKKRGRYETTEFTEENSVCTLWFSLTILIMELRKRYEGLLPGVL